MKNNLFFTCLLFISTFNFAEASTYWLGTNVNSDGSIQSQNVLPIGTNFQATASSIEAYLYFGQSSDVKVSNGLNYLIENNYGSTEELSRIIQIQAQISQVNSEYVDLLLERVNPDGGIGEYYGFSSNVLDSAWALLAFYASDSVGEEVIENMISYIVSEVHEDSGYSTFKSDDSSIYTTSLVGIALNKYKNTYSYLNTYLQNIGNYLVSMQEAEGGWSEIHQTALAIIALYQSNYSPSSYWLSVQHLRNTKASISNYNHQWLEDVYTTALALIAEDMTSGMSQHSTNGSVIGRVIDSANLDAINGAKITLDGLSYKVDYSDPIGIFNFANISNSIHSLLIEYPGYLSESINFETINGDNLNIGDIHLIKNPDTGLVKGIVTDNEDGEPLPGALITINADTSYSTHSDSFGRYQLEIPPGSFEIFASYSQRDTVYAQSTISAGQILDFSPTLYANGIGLSQVEITGRVVDQDSHLPLENALVQTNLSNNQYFTDIEGNFIVSDQELGNINLTLSADGYHNMELSLILSGGNVNLGDLAMIPINQATTSSIFGTVKDGNILLPGVTVSISGTDLSTITDSEGNYSISNIPESNYTVIFTNAGYETLYFDISSQQHATSELNVILDKVGASSLIITEFLPEQFEYQGLTEVEFDIELFNSTHYSEARTRLYLQVKNSNDEIVSYYPLKTIPFGGTLDDALEILSPGQFLPLTITWGMENYIPDEYIFDLLAYDENSENLLRQATTSVTLLPFKAIDGNVSFQPKIVNYSPSTPIQISTILQNVGSEPIGNVNVSAEVILTAKEDDSIYTTGRRIDEFSDSLMSLPRIMKKDSVGNLIIYNASSRNFVKFKLDGTFELMFNIGGVGDFSLNSFDQIYTINGYCQVRKYNENGELLNSFSTGLHECRSRSLEIIDNDNVYIASDSGIHNLNLNTGILTEVIGNYLQDPQGMIRHSDGRIIIADGLQNSLLVYENNTLSKWISGFNNPHGLCEDNDGSILVANYSSDEIIRVQNDGTRSIVTSSIPSPFDIKVNPNGGYYVSSEVENKLYQLNSDGSSSVIYNSYINVPTIIVEGNHSDVYIYNSANREIIHKLSDGTVEKVTTTPNVVYSMVVDNNDSLIISMPGNLFRLEEDSSFTELSSSNINVSMIETTNDSNKLLISTTYGKINIFNTDTNLIEDYIESPFGSIIAAQTDSNNLTYLLDSIGKLTTLDEAMNYHIIASGLGTTKDLFISHTDEIYIARSDKTIIKLDADNNFNIVANLTNVPDKFVVNTLGEVIYSDKSNNLYINSGGSESIYITLNENIYGDVAIDIDNRLLVTLNSNNIVQISANQIVNTITIDQSATGIYIPKSISMNQITGVAWVSFRGGVFKIDSSGNISDIFSSSQLPVSNLVALPNSFIAAGSNVLLQFDSMLNYQKSFSNFSEIFDMELQDNNDLILSVKKPYKGLLQFTSPNKLPELIHYGLFYEINKSYDDNHLLVLTFNKLLNFNILTKTETELTSVKGELTKITNVDNSEIHIIDRSENMYSVYDFSGNRLLRHYGLNRLQGLAVNDQSELFLTDAVNIYQLNQDNSIEIAYSSLPGKYMEIHNGIIYKSFSTWGSLYKINLETQEHDEISTPTTQISSVIYMDGNTIEVGTSGLFFTTISGETEPLINSVDNIGDMIKTMSGEFYFTSTSSNTGLASILKLENGVIKPHRTLSELQNIRVNYLTEENGLLFAYNESISNPDLLIINENNTKILKPFSVNGHVNSIIIDDNYLYGLTDENIIYKSEIIDKSLDAPLVGDIVYTDTVSINIDSEEVQFSFSPFYAPIAGDYQVNLAFSDTDILGEFKDSLHVGNIANGMIELSEYIVSPGDSTLSTITSIEGLDISSFVDIVEGEEELIYDYDGSFYDMANFVVINQDTYYLLSPRRTVKKYSRNINENYELYTSQDLIVQLLKDRNGNLVLLGQSNYPTKWLDLEGNLLLEKNLYDSYGITAVKSGDFDDDNQLVVLGKFQNESDYSIFKIDIVNDTFIRIRNNVSVQSNISIDGGKNVYLMGSSIIKANLENGTTEILRDNIGQEGESIRNGVLVCNNTPLFTDITASFHEESEIYSVYGDIIYDSSNKDLYPGESYSKLADIETLYYDKDINQLFLFNHHWYTSGTLGRGHHGDIISIPVNCGKMYVELHLTDQSNTSLSDFDIIPDNTVEVAENVYEYTWLIDNLDEVQKVMNFQTHVDDLLPNESRPILQSAYLNFRNSLNPQEELIVNLEIPEVLGIAEITIEVTLDNSEYQGDTDIQISSTVNNEALIEFNGTVNQQILDSNGNLVSTLDPLQVKNLSGNSQITLNNSWYTANYYSGQYTLVSTLLDENGDFQDQFEQTFNIIPDEVNQSNVDLRVLTNKSQYTTYDLIEISQSVTNLSQNNILENHTAQIQLTSPDGIVLFQKTTDLNALTPNASQNWQDQFTLNNATTGFYTVSLNLLDENSVITSNDTYVFEVILDQQQVLSGLVVSAYSNIQPGVDNLCSYELNNTSNQNINSIEVHQTVVNLSNQLTVQDDIATISLNAVTSWNNQKTIPTNQLSSGDHACILRTIINNEEETQASAVFFVQGANQLSGHVWNDENSDGSMDETEFGIEFVEVKLLDNNLAEIETVYTDSQGIYHFNPVYNGEYNVVVTENEILNNYILTSENNPTLLNVINSHEVINFGYYREIQYGAVNGIIFDDINGNGIQDSSEPGVSDISVELNSANGSSNAATLSDGSYSFENVLPDTYQLTVTDSNGDLTYYQLTTNNQPLEIEVVENETNSLGIFGYQAHLSSITGSIIKDDNANGLLDAGESGYANITVQLSGNGLTLESTTDTTGIYSFNQLATGTYLVTITDNNSVLANTVLIAGSNSYQVNLGTNSVDNSGFAAYQLRNSSVSGLIFRDSDGNGIQDSNETGLDGVSIDLLSLGDVIDTQITVNGGYNFSQLAAGNYQIVITDTNAILTDTQMTTAVSLDITLAENQESILDSIGYQYHNAVISGIVFNDMNNDGIIDASENGIESVTINLMNGSDILQTILSQADGSYSFNQLVQGSYVLEITDDNQILAQYHLTTDNQPYSTDISESQQLSGVNFGYQLRNSQISGFVIKDDNGDGIQNNSELGYENVTIELSSNIDINMNTVTSASGEFVFTELPAGDFNVTVTDNNSVLIHTELTSNNQPYETTIESGTTDSNANFAYQLRNSGVSGQIFEDTNGNGILDGNETGISGITVDLIENNNVVTTITTDNSGSYQFSQLVSGQYQLVITDIAGLLEESALTTSNHPYDVNLDENENLELISFGYQYHNAVVSGYIYNDLNQNGVFDEDDTYLPSITLEIKDSNEQLISSTQSDFNGYFEFNHLLTQSYTVEVTDESLVTDWFNTTNNNPTSLITTNASHQTVNFGFFEVDTNEIEVDTTIMESNGRGRILIMLDKPGNFIDENTCGGIHSWKLGLNFNSDTNLDSDTIVSARLYSSDSQLLQTEETLFSDFDTSLDLVTEPNNANLVITGLNNNSIEILVTADALDEYAVLNDNYYVEVQVENFEGSESWLSQSIANDCNSDQDVGQMSGDFNIVELVAAPSAITDEPYGPEQAPTLSAQRQHLEELLIDADWSYTITETAEEFQQEFYSRQYNLYAIFSEKIKLPTDFQYELVDAFESGEGLFVATGHDLRNQKLYPSLGVKIQGKHPNVESIRLDESVLHSAAEENINLEEVVLKVKMAGATSVGVFTGTSGNANTTNALTHTGYGDGKGVFGALDLLIQSTYLDDVSQTLSVYSELILNSISYVHNELLVGRIGKAQRIKLQLNNEGIAFSGTVKFSLPQGTTLAHINSTYTQENQQVSIGFNLEEDQTFEIEIWIILNESPQTLSFDILDFNQDMLQTLTTTLTATQE